MTTPDPLTYLAPVQELDRLRAENARLTSWLAAANATIRSGALTEIELVQAIEARDEFEKSYVHFHAAYEQAEARVDQLTDTLALRSDALNRTGESNDQLRATIAAVRKLADDAEKEPRPVTIGGWMIPATIRADSILAILDDQEPTK